MKRMKRPTSRAVLSLALATNQDRGSARLVNRTDCKRTQRTGPGPRRGNLLELRSVEVTSLSLQNVPSRYEVALSLSDFEARIRIP